MPASRADKSDANIWINPRSKRTTVIFLDGDAVVYGRPPATSREELTQSIMHSAGLESVACRIVERIRVDGRHPAMEMTSVYGTAVHTCRLEFSDYSAREQFLTSVRRIFDKEAGDTWAHEHVAWSKLRGARWHIAAVAGVVVFFFALLIATLYPIALREAGEPVPGILRPFDAIGFRAMLILGIGATLIAFIAMLGRMEKPPIFDEWTRRRSNSQAV